MFSGGVCSEEGLVPGASSPGFGSETAEGSVDSSVWTRSVSAESCRSNGPIVFQKFERSSPHLSQNLASGAVISLAQYGQTARVVDVTYSRKYTEQTSLKDFAKPLARDACLLAESSLPSLIGPDCPQEVDLTEFRPVDIEEDEFAVCRLPE